MEVAGLFGVMVVAVLPVVMVLVLVVVEFMLVVILVPVVVVVLVVVVMLVHAMWNAGKGEILLVHHYSDKHAMYLHYSLAS